MLTATRRAKEIWEGAPADHRARSLAVQRIAEIDVEKGEDKEMRERSCRAMAKADTFEPKAAWWRRFLGQLDGDVRVFRATLESPLIIDSSASPVENAGLSLDRTSGLAMIPGSAVKGIARRFAVQEILDAESAAVKEERLDLALRIFGWVGADLKPGRNDIHQPLSDWWYAMAPADPDGDPENEKQDAVRDREWRAFLEDRREIPGTSREGEIVFFPAFPTRRDAIGVDILTPHHMDYYGGKDKAGEPKEAALDDDDPKPLAFPVVKQGVEFGFACQTHRDGSGEALSQAIAWLQQAIALFGAGAKTTAGYGWFGALTEGLPEPRTETP